MRPANVLTVISVAMLACYLTDPRHEDDREDDQTASPRGAPRQAMMLHRNRAYRARVR